MKTRTSGISALALLAALLVALPTGFAMADDGSTGVEDGKPKPVLKSMSHNADPEPGGIPEAEHAFIAMMKFYVPAQGANGETTLIDYLNREGGLITSSGYAKPLIGVYMYGCTARPKPLTASALSATASATPLARSASTTA